MTETEYALQRIAQLHSVYDLIEEVYQEIWAGESRVGEPSLFAREAMETILIPLLRCRTLRPHIRMALTTGLEKARRKIIRQIPTGQKRRHPLREEVAAALERYCRVLALAHPVEAARGIEEMFALLKQRKRLDTRVEEAVVRVCRLYKRQFQDWGDWEELLVHPTLAVEAFLALADIDADHPRLEAAYAFLSDLAAQHAIAVDTTWLREIWMRRREEQRRIGRLLSRYAHYGSLAVADQQWLLQQAEQRWDARGYALPRAIRAVLCPASLTAQGGK